LPLVFAPYKLGETETIASTLLSFASSPFSSEAVSRAGRAGRIMGETLIAAAARNERATRESIVEACRAMDRLGISQGTSGNISVRWDDGLLLTPSGLPCHEMTPDDVVHLRMDGTWDHPLRPSSEWRFHRDIMKSRTDVGAIVHAHPT
jgi:hypothetical protein